MSITDPTETVTGDPDTLREAHAFLDRWLKRVPLDPRAATETPTLEFSRSVAAMSAGEARQIVFAMLEKLIKLDAPAEELRRQWGSIEAGSEAARVAVWHHWLTVALRDVLQRTIEWNAGTLARLVTLFAQASPSSVPIRILPDIIENHCRQNPEQPEELKAAAGQLSRLIVEHSFWHDGRGLSHRVEKAAGIPRQLHLVRGEAWSDQVVDDLQALPPEERCCWELLLAHCQDSESGKPSAKWLKRARELVDAVGAAAVIDRLSTWFPLVDRPRTQPKVRAFYEHDWTDRILEPHAALLKGLCWIASMHDDDARLPRLLGSLGLSAFRKLPGVGPRLVKVGNAAIYALSQIGNVEAVGQLAMLKVRVASIPAQKEIAKALQSAAAALNLPADEVEEMAVPTYGMEEVGRRVEQLGETSAEILVDGVKVELSWRKSGGKRSKSPPKQVKDEHTEELKELKAAVKDIERMLPAQRERLDQLFLQDRSWPYETWRQRYLDHSLVGTIARRLIWTFHDGNTRAAVWLDGRLVDAAGQRIAIDERTSQVKLWHPIDHPERDVLAWRCFFEERRIRQPFKQAHREVYLLTDAERNTRTYSNRFAAHIIRQHQFNALARARGWKHVLQLVYDGRYPPATRLLPRWNLGAEFCVEGVLDGVADSNDTGVFLRVATDQVRFYPIPSDSLALDTEVDPLPLDQIPPLVFSEIMRDVDLFVGVASVGNDPAWQDGGPAGRYRDYWHNYSFGDLSQTAETRKAVLERIVPRLKIAERCNMDGRFLIVRGDLRTYKIHLGSGNILMEPNDQYLCIVPGRSTDNGSTSGASGGGGGGGGVFLPFEGDQTLSVILSKAFLLANDRAIKDQSIVSQIRRGAAR